MRSRVVLAAWIWIVSRPMNDGEIVKLEVFSAIGSII